jgi:ABC-2 type transport system ATP-binding protein
MLAFTNALWAGAELLDRKQVDNHCTVTLRLAGNNTVNNLFAAIMPICEIISFNEVIPSMSDIFIRTVQPDIQ